MNWLENQVNVSSVSNREILFNNVTYLYHFIILLTILWWPNRVSCRQHTAMC